MVNKKNKNTSLTDFEEITQVFNRGGFSTGHLEEKPNSNLIYKENYRIEIILPNKYKKIGNEQILKTSIEKMYEQIANNEIESIMEKTRKMLGMAPEEYKIAKMKDALGKCINGKITINPELIFCREEICKKYTKLVH